MDIYPAKSEKVRWIERKEGAILLNPKKGRYHKLNVTATFIWQRSNGIKTIEEISQLMAKEYNINRERARRDTFCIVNHLKSLGLVRLFRDKKRFYPR